MKICSSTPFRGRKELPTGMLSDVIIFDGYLQPSTKDMVHGIRNPIASLEIDVAFDNVVDCKRELLLSNPKNKHKFIGLLNVDGRVRRRAISRKPVRSRCCFVFCTTSY